jgi:hypothetical protein
MTNSTLIVERGDLARMDREFPALKPIEIENFYFPAYPLLLAVFEKMA